MKRVLLLVLVGTLTVAAALGIGALLLGDLFRGSWRIFASLGALFLFTLPALSAATMLERRHWVLLNRIAMVVAAAGLGFYLLVIWLNLERLLDAGAWKVLVILAVWAWALPWGAMLAMARLGDFYGLVRLGAIAVTFAMAGLITIAVLLEWDDVPPQLFGIVGILLALGSVATPILHKVAGLERVEAVESTPLEVTLTCPRCLLAQQVSCGASRCRGCRLKFTLEIEKPRCPSCDYLLYRLTKPRCPECGTALGAHEVAPAAEPPVAQPAG